MQHSKLHVRDDVYRPSRVRVSDGCQIGTMSPSYCSVRSWRSRRSHTHRDESTCCGGYACAAGLP
jgi:hypothetical protein